jgi:hypothetical protein
LICGITTRECSDRTIPQTVENIFGRIGFSSPPYKNLSPSSSCSYRVKITVQHLHGGDNSFSTNFAFATPKGVREFNHGGKCPPTPRFPIWTLARASYASPALSTTNLPSEQSPARLAGFRQPLPEKRDDRNVPRIPRRGSSFENNSDNFCFLLNSLHTLGLSRSISRFFLTPLPLSDMNRYILPEINTRLIDL